MQLVAYGAQDIYLTGNPQITFFKVVYRRHTNFSMEEIEQTPNGEADFGQTASYTISRNGDLVHKMYFEFRPKGSLSNSAGTADKVVIRGNIGHTLLKEVECEIGGQKIDKHYSHWLATWNQLTDLNPTGSFNIDDKNVATSSHGVQLAVPNANDASQPSGRATSNADKNGLLCGSSVTANTLVPAIGAEPSSKATLYQTMSFNHNGYRQFATFNKDNTGHDAGTPPAGATRASALAVNLSGTDLLARVPLQFWFNRNPGLALPLIALQYHEVKIKITFCAGTDIMPEASTTLTSDLKEGKLWAQYIYLDTDERRRFAQVSHEYLIEQLQFQDTSKSKSMNLNFNHPVKELVWGKAPVLATGDTDPSLSHALIEPTTSHKKFLLKLNGHDRFAERDREYFTRQQVYDHHTGFGGTFKRDSICVYSFALKPEEHQPSGTCNFSRIDTAQLVGDHSQGDDLYIYAVNYNVLRIMSGMGGLAYSN